jgi:hypothetical protein
LSAYLSWWDCPNVRHEHLFLMDGQPLDTSAFDLLLTSLRLEMTRNPESTRVESESKPRSRERGGLDSTRSAGRCSCGRKLV